MTDHIVIDVEIQKTIEETPGGWDSTDKLGVSVAVIYEFLTDRFRVYGENDLIALRERLEKADRISGFNIWKFDYPVIYSLPGRERVHQLKDKTNDILRRIWISLGLNADEFSSLHKNWNLNTVARSTIGVEKSGFGGDAPKWYQQGNWSRLVDYCIDDVKIERDLTIFIDKYGYVNNDILNRRLIITRESEKK